MFWQEINLDPQAQEAEQRAGEETGEKEMTVSEEQITEALKWADTADGLVCHSNTLAAEVKRLRAELEAGEAKLKEAEADAADADYCWGPKLEVMRLEKEAAEAEIERLRKALEQIILEHKQYFCRPNDYSKGFREGLWIQSVIAKEALESRP